jgi:hypothetical protein
MKPKRTRALLAARPKRLFELEPVAQHNTREMIKNCLRSKYPWTPVTRSILENMLADIQRYGRLATPVHCLLLVFARRCGVGP